MFNLPKRFVILDTEYTTWEGAMKRKWSGPNEFKEIVQIGAILVDCASLKEKKSVVLFVKPIINPTLSEYFVRLTGITQAKVEKNGTSLKSALTKLDKWSLGCKFYSFGLDGDTIAKNCELIGIKFSFKRDQFHNIKTIFEKHGISTKGYMSSTILEAFGKKPSIRGHNAVNDTRLVLHALRELAAKVSGKSR